MTTSNAISLRGLYKIFGPNPQHALELVRDGMGKAELQEKHGTVLALKDITLNIPERGIFVIMGLSGCGKSTLLRHINRLIEPTLGAVEIAGCDILSLSEAELRDLRRNDISMVFQRFALLPHRTVLENIAYGLEIQGTPARTAHERARTWITRVGLTGFETSYPAQLSGGMQQRVGLARALATNAGILLMDEPFSALDPLIREDMQNMLLELQAELNKTIVFITHDLDEALRLGDEIAILRDGELVQQGNSQEIVLTPANSYVKDFVKNINRGRVIKIRAIMSNQNLAELKLTLAEDMVLEDALLTLTQAKTQAANVSNAAGKIIGSIALDDIIRAMASKTSP